MKKMVKQLITYYAILILLNLKKDTVGYPCPYHGTNAPCICTHHAVDGDAIDQCVEWAKGPYFRRTMGRKVTLGEMQIKQIPPRQTEGPHFQKQGYCRLKQPGPRQEIPLAWVAGKNTTSKVDQLYAHPHYGLVGVNTTTHAKARFGNEGTYQNDYRMYVPECHCFVKIKEVTSNGWERLLDDWTLWMGITDRLRAVIPHNKMWQYESHGKTDTNGWELVKLKIPRPPERLLFQRHLDYRVVSLVNLTDRYPRGFKDLFQDTYQNMLALSARKTTDPNRYPKATWIKKLQMHGNRAIVPDYVHHILVGVMYYLADHASVTVQCSREILQRQPKLGFGVSPGEKDILSIPYTVAGYVQSWVTIGAVLMDKSNNGARFMCKFVPGVPRPITVGPPYVWIHTPQRLKVKIEAPKHLATPLHGLQVVHSIPQDSSVLNRSAIRVGNTTFHKISNYPIMWGDRCREKQKIAKCHKRLVDIETKVRYREAFYDPYNNRSELPDHNQSVVFFPPRPKIERNKRQVFAALAVVTAFAVQGVVDYAGYEGIQGVEQELNDDMNTRAAANNVRFRQADNAIGNLSRQIQDLNSKIEQLSESDEATVRLLLQTVKTQAVEDAVLQEQISSNQRTLVVLARAHLEEATANRAQSDAQVFLLQAITKELTTKSSDFLTAGIAYSWKLSNGMMHLQALEQQLQPIYNTDYQLITQKLHNLTCSEILGESERNQDQLRHLETSIKIQLQGDHNLTKWINETKPKFIKINYIPEYQNRTVLQSGEKMREAFEKVMKKPIPALEEAGKKVLGAAEEVIGAPIKKVLSYTAAVLAAITVIWVVKWLVTRKPTSEKPTTEIALRQTTSDLKKL